MKKTYEEMTYEECREHLRSVLRRLLSYSNPDLMFSENIDVYINQLDRDTVDGILSRIANLYFELEVFHGKSFFHKDLLEDLTICGKMLRRLRTSGVLSH